MNCPADSPGLLALPGRQSALAIIWACRLYGIRDHSKTHISRLETLHPRDTGRAHRGSAGFAFVKQPEMRWDSCTDSAHNTGPTNGIAIEASGRWTIRYNVGANLRGYLPDAKMEFS